MMVMMAMGMYVLSGDDSDDGDCDEDDGDDGDDNDDNWSVCADDAACDDHHQQKARWLDNKDGHYREIVTHTHRAPQRWLGQHC